LNRTLYILRLWRVAVIALAIACGTSRLLAMIVVTNGASGLGTDLTIVGGGWFVVRDPASDKLYATRLGDFRVDYDNYILNSAGLRLQGYSGESNSVMGDLRLQTSRLNTFILAFWIDADGKIWADLADGQKVVTGQILLQDFSAPQQLTRVAHKLYRISSAALPKPMAVPGTAGVGVILTGGLDPTPEPVNLSVEPNAQKVGPLAQGVLTETGVRTDLGITGEGFFLVRNTNTSELFATRAGLFLLDGDGYLITYDRLRIQGYTDADLTTLGDVRLDESGKPTSSFTDAVMYSSEIRTDGQVWVWLSDGTSFLRGKIQLFAFNHPERLSRTNHGLYAGVTHAEPRMVNNPGGIYEDGIHQGRLELINVTDDLLAIRRTLNLEQTGGYMLTNSLTELAVCGHGYFLVKNPATGDTYATRLGSFHFDSDGYLITSEGLRVQGYSDAALSILGDIRLDTTGKPDSTDPLATVLTYGFDFYGNLLVWLSDGTVFVRGQILLQNFKEPFLLAANQSGLYTNLATAGPLPLAASPPAGSFFTAYFDLVFSGVREIQSDSTQHLTLPSREGFRLRITGEPGQHWTIQASTNFTAWTDLCEVTNTPDELEFSDSQSMDYPRRFYRVVVTNP
jgi:flagellar hook protein FlgE